MFTESVGSVSRTEYSPPGTATRRVVSQRQTSKDAVLPESLADPQGGAARCLGVATFFPLNFPPSNPGCHPQCSQNPGSHGPKSREVVARCDGCAG